MEDPGSDLVFALPLVVVGVLLVGLGWRDARRYLRTATGSWRTRLRSPALLMPGFGALMLAIAALVALGLFAAGIGLLDAAGAAGVVALVVSAVRSYRAGRRRHALATMGFSALCLLEITALVFDWHVDARRRRPSTRVVGPSTGHAGPGTS